MTVSQDAIVREKPADRMAGPTPGALSDTSEIQGQELVYAARISLDRTHMQIDDRNVQLAPGTAVRAESRLTNDVSLKICVTAAALSPWRREGTMIMTSEPSRLAQALLANPRG